MTRINVIDPVLLSDQHVMAEYRELPMVMGSLRRILSSKQGWNFSKVPPKYTLNAGHVYFFTNKKKFLERRFSALVAELKFRGYKIDPSSRTIDWGVFEKVPQIDWEPSLQCEQINRERIRQRLMQKPDWYRWTNRSRVDF